MKRFIILFSLFSLILLSCSPVKDGYVAVCGGNEVKIIDMDNSDGRDIREVWSWKTDDPESGLPGKYAGYLTPLDECKFVDGNTKLLLTSSKCAVVLLDIKSRKALFHAKVPMAHSAEMLPGGRVAVALSTHKKGNALEIYDVRHPEKVLYRDTLYSGHGVLWNEKRQSLYALGHSELREYKLKDWETATPSLDRVSTWKLPVYSGHDLSLVDQDSFLISGREGVVWFYPESGTFAPYEPLKDLQHIKSVNYRKSDGRLLYTVAEERWWTHNVYQKNPDRMITIDSMKIYKVRPVW